MKGYGKSLVGYGAVVVVVDNDSRICRDFKQELNAVLSQCHPAPQAAFCIAIEEIEAWLLGDIDAVIRAYPSAKRNVLDAYNQDSICNTWEVLADALCLERAAGLRRIGYPEIGIRKSEWAEKIAPLVEIDRNNSSSFKYFVRKVKEMAGLDFNGAGGGI